MVPIPSPPLCDAAATDTAASNPPLRSSRRSRSRPFRHRHSHREIKWKQTICETLKRNKFSPPTSDVDQHNIHTPQSKPKLLQLSRPSQIVPDIDPTAASDIDLNPLERHTHRRRVCATSVQLQYIGNSGIQKAVPAFKRVSRGLKKYTHFLVPPEEDQYFQPSRIPRSLLSSYYRGSALASFRPGHPTRLEKKRLQSAPKSSEYSSAVSDQEFCTDSSDFFSSSPEDNDDTHFAPLDSNSGRRDPSALTRHRPPASLQNACVEISDGSDKDTLLESNLQQPPDVEAKSDSKPQKKPAEEQPEALLAELFDMAQNNPNELLQTEPNAPAAPTQNGQDNVDSLEKDENPDAIEKGAVQPEKPLPEKPLTSFEKDMQLGMKFCNAPRKRTWHEVQTISVDQHDSRGLPSAITGKLTDNTGSPKAPAPSYGSRILEKMGFKGRLGRQEDGIAEPIRIKKPRTGRPGIGLQSPETIDDELADAKNSPKRNGHNSSVLPTSFKGDVNSKKRVDNEARRVQLGSDVYNRRKVSARNSGENATKPGADAASTGGTVNSSVDLDDNDEYETAREDSEFDNSRRAIILDVNVLIKNSHARRIAAFKALFQQSDAIPKTVNVERTLNLEPRDLSDTDSIHKILLEAGNEDSVSSMDALMDELNKVYKTVEAPVLHTEVLDLLKSYSRDVYFGLLHTGSRGRLSDELKHLNLSNCFLQGPRSCIKDGDEWPYLETRKDLLCRVGLRARQSVFLTKESACGDTVLGGCTAAAIMGSGAMTVSVGKKETILRVIGLENGLEDTSFSLQKALNDRGVFIEKFAVTWAKLPKRRRVLALYSADGLWYGGIEKYGEYNVNGPKQGYSLIEFHKYENLEWVSNDNVVPLARKDFRRLRKADFIGLLSPEDVDDL